MRRVLAAGLLGALLLAAPAACGQTDDRASSSASTTVSSGRSPNPSRHTVAPVTEPPCDAGGGFPRPRAGCPDPEPETGWLTGRDDGVLRLAPLRTLTNDAAGKAYAEQHGLEYPFSNDYADVPDGRPHALHLRRDTVCTGIIVVGYQEPLADHVVDCAELVRVVAAGRRVTVAVWRDGDRVAQVSELYRP